MNKLLIYCLNIIICIFILLACDKATISKQPIQSWESWDYQQDKKISVVSGEASSYQIGESIEKSFDNNPNTIYHSSWNSTEFPVTLIYHFAPNDTIDYIVYNPRIDGGINGNFQEFEIWSKTTGNTDYQKMGNYNFEGNSQVKMIKLTDNLINLESIKFIIKSGSGDNNGFVSCSEMEFYKSANENSIPDIFTDMTCSRLKSNISLKDIEAVKTKRYKELAKSLYNNTYSVSDRVKEYKPYPDPLKVAKKNKTSSYSLLDNITGIYIEEGNDIIIFVGSTFGQNISLRSVDLDVDYDYSDYILKEGINIIKAKKKGLLYVMYHTDDPNAKPIKINIVSGNINGHFDITQHTNEDWNKIVDVHSSTPQVSKYIDVLGKYAHLTFAIDDFKKYTSNIVELIQVYDSIVWLESNFIGLNKYDRANKNRMYFYISPMEYYMFATSFRTGYNKDCMPSICNPQKLRSTEIWGPAHEVGHMNQTDGFNWVGLTEVSNNVYAMYVQNAFKNPSRLATEKLHSDFDGYWSNRYEKGFTEMIAGKIPHMMHSDVFCKLIPFWQLELYNSQVNGYKDFYADVHEQIRANPIPKSDSEAQLQFMRICCDVARTDFTDFFSKWGLLSVIDENVMDHSSIQDVVNYTKEFTITQKQINELKSYVKKYKKPELNIHYIHDDAVTNYINNMPIEKGTIKKENGKVYMERWKNVVVYEIYDNTNKLIFVSPSSIFDIPTGVNATFIHAIGSKGNGIIIKL